LTRLHVKIITSIGVKVAMALAIAMSFFRDGSIANGGRNLANRFCEGVAPSYYDMARGRDGYFYCYQFTPNHLVMNQGRPVPQGNCQR
jgi:hypothetical protein